VLLLLLFPIGHHVRGVIDAINVGDIGGLVDQACFLRDLKNLVFFAPFAKRT
jgi:hypothetical protein